MTPAEIEQGRRIKARLSVAEHFRAPSDKDAAMAMFGPLLDAYEAAVAENARLREGLAAWQSGLRESDHDPVRGPYYGEHTEHIADRIGALLSGGGA